MCHDTYGGQRIAEYMVFTTLLPDEKRQRIYNALRNKWFGDAPGTTNFYNNLSLGAAAEMTVKYEALAVTNRLTLAGSLTAPVMSAANIEVAGTNATVTGELTVEDGATLSFARQADGSWPMLSVTSLATGGAVTVELSAEDVRGLVSAEARIIAMDNPPPVAGWRVAANLKKASARLESREDGVYAVFCATGTIFTIR